MNTTAFLAHSGRWNVDERVISKAKIATLLHERLVFSGPSDPTRFAEITAEMRNEPALSPFSRESAAACWSNVPPDTPHFDLWADNALATFNAAPPALKLATTSALLELGLSPRDRYDDWKLQLYTILEIQYWREHLPDSTFIGHDISDSTLQLLSAPLISSDGVQELVSPPTGVQDLCWNDVFELRRSPFLKQFRNEHARLAGIGKLSSLSDNYLQALEHLADEVRPNVRTAAGLAVLTNLPIPFVNPFHVGHSIYEVWHQAKVAEKFGWVMFMRDARRLASKDTRDD